MQEKLNNFVSFYSGLTYSPADVTSSKDGVLVLRSSNIENDKIVFTDNIFVKKSKANSKYVEKNDLIVVVRNGSRPLLGKHALVEDKLENTVIGAFMTGIQSQSPHFVNNLLGTVAFKREIHKNLGATINQITNKNFRDMKFFIPNLEEANKIGELLKKLNHIITLEQEWYKSINLKKQFLIRNLFPSDDLKPHLRFEGYSTNWKIKKIKEIAEIHNKLRVPIKESLREPGKTPYYGANGIQGYVSGYTHKGEFTLIAEDGANDITNYPTIFVSGEIWVNNHAHVLTGKADILDTEFLTYYIQSMNIAKYLVGSGRWKLNAGILAEIPIVLPQLEEQIKIRNILKSIDKLIIKSKNKIEYYKNLKEILLKEMFI